MVSYRLDGAPGTRPLASGRPVPQTQRTIADYIAETRMAANEYQHPVAIFDLDGQPVFRNAALAARLTSEQQSQSSDRTWQLVYATSCRIVAEAIVARSGISTVVPLHQRSFVILGSLLRQPSGSVYGATVHIAEIKGAAAGAAMNGSSESSPIQESHEGDEAYRSWVQRRDESRSRMQRLSPREAEVVSRVSAGLPNKSIARELEISVKTIEKHRANAVRKLGVASTPEMVRIAVLADADHDPAPQAPSPTLAGPLGSVAMSFSSTVDRRVID